MIERGVFLGYLRFILALAVVLHHTRGAPYLLSGAFAVELFFCISGFYMAMVLEKKYKGRLALFYTNRLYRLLPAYFIAIVLSGIFLLLNSAPYVTRGEFLLGLQSPQAIPFILSNITVLGQEATAFFSWYPESGSVRFDASQSSGVPTYHLLLVPQAWSISLEMLFYAMAPFVVLRSRLRVLWILILISFAIRTAILWFDIPYNSWGRRAFPSVAHFFFLGAAAYHLMVTYSAKLRDVRKSIVVIAFLALLIVLYRLRFPRQQDWLYFYPVITLFGAVLLPLLFQHLSSRFEAIMGELSYPIYLFHTVWIGLFESILAKQNVPHKGSILTVLVVCATIGSSYLVYRFVEKPVDLIRQRRLKTSLTRDTTPI